MADAVIVPSEVDAALRELVVFNTGVVENAEALRPVIGLSRANIVAGYRFVAGFSTSRSTGGGSMPDTTLVNLAMRFADHSAAAAAARALVDTDMTLRRTAIPRHPDSAALAFKMARGVILESFSAHGPYLLYQWVQTKNSVEAAAELIAKTLDLQGPRIDQFVPTDPSRLASLSFDTNGLLANTLPAKAEVFSAATGEYSARAALHFQTDPMEAAALFKDAGVESVSLRESMVLQARNRAAAAHLVDELAAHASAAGATEIQGVAGLPNAKCVDADMDAYRALPRFRCYAFAGRYAYETFSEQQDDARKKTAAQYLILRQYHP